MVAATRELLAAGTTATVEQAANRAGISRTTAYRYFPNQRTLLLAAYPVLDTRSLLDPDAPEDPAARLAVVIDRFTRLVLAHEPELRVMLRLSLESSASGSALPLRQGRAIRWIEEALVPLRKSIRTARLRRLVLAIRATTGIEALVWLCDVAGLSREEAVTVMTWSARSLLQAARAESAASPREASATTSGRAPRLRTGR
jgi:AcrR family transcriptional regulator